MANSEKIKNYLAKDFESLRGNIQEYIENYYSDKLSDFSESGLAGMFVDMAAYIGDNMSYYLDFQFNELDIETSVDIRNIQKHMRANGISPRGPSPSRAEVSISIVVPLKYTSGNEPFPNTDYLPVLRSGSKLTSSAGITFELIEDLDFRKKDENGKYLFSYRLNPANTSTFIIEKIGSFISGNTIEETISIGSTFVPFRKIQLSNIDINEIISVIDDNDNVYYEVENLTQDVVFSAIPNYRDDKNTVSDILEMKSAARRFVVERDIVSGLVSIVFGSGNEEIYESDLMPPPEEIALNMFGKRTFTNFSIDTNNIIKTDTLGISPTDTTLKIKYRVGGGLSHNVPAGSINTTSEFTLDFNSSVPVSQRTAIRNSMQVRNNYPSYGGENQPTIEELKFITINSKSLQSRIVSKEDLMSRIYTMPSNLGRVYRASVISNLDNPFSASLFILTRNSNGTLTYASDTMKKNIKTFLNKFRLVSDSIDILDAPIVNIAISYTVTVDSLYNKNAVIKTINSKIAKFMKIEGFQIGTPIIKSDLAQLILNVSGVTSVERIQISNKSESSPAGNPYSNFTYSIESNTYGETVYPPEGGIFELKYPDFDISGNARS